MEIGWIDFSKEERNKVLSVIHLLDEPSAVDELGIGIIRDAFADCFFPGTSTVQTRAKYFLVVPYILKEAGDGRYGSEINTILRKIDDTERKCRDIFIKTSTDGVIGSLVPSSWVVRTPSNIYWNGIKKLGIFREDLSIKEYVRQCLLQRTLKQAKADGNSEENEKDDIDAGDFASFQMWELGNLYREDWMENLSIELLPEEARFLRTQIITNQRDTLFAYILKNNISLEKYETFGALTAAIEGQVAHELQDTITLANQFNSLVALITTRYNLIVSQGENEDAMRRWNTFSKDLQKRSNVDLRRVYEKMHIKNIELRMFLLHVQEAFRSKDVNRADELIINREVSIKDESRAKTRRPGEYPTDSWVGIDMLDYRYSPARRVIKDIMNAEVC